MDGAVSNEVFFICLQFFLFDIFQLDFGGDTAALTDSMGCIVPANLCTYQKIEASEKCDLMKCILKIKLFISDLRKVGTPFQCRKLQNISYCSDNCMQNYFPQVYQPQSKVNMGLNFAEFCDKHLSHRQNANWSCIASHAVRLLTCFGNVSSITANDVRENMMHIETCRKSLEYQNCPSKVLLEDCGAESVVIMKKIIDFMKPYFKIPFCEATEMKNLYSVQLHYRLENDYMEVAKCYDVYHNFVSSCFDQRLQDDIDLKEFLCGDHEYLNCFDTYMSASCKALPNISRLLPQLFSLGGIKCKQSNFDLKHLTPDGIQDSEEQAASHDKQANSQHILNDQDDVPSSIESLSFATISSVSSIAEVDHENFRTSTHTAVFQYETLLQNTSKSKSNDEIDKNLENKNNQNINVKGSYKLKKVISGDSVKNSSKISQEEEDVKILQASSGNYVYCDRTLFAILFFIMILY